MSDKGKKRLALLGAGGFLGSHLVQALLNQSAFEVVALDLNFEKVEVRSPRLECVLGSVADRSLLERWIPTCSVVVSCSALCNPALYNTKPTQVIEANFLDLVPLVQMCTERSIRLIHLSTCEVYGRGGPDVSDALMKEDSGDLVFGPIAAQRWSYACAKQLLERFIWAQGAQYQLEATIVRPFNVIGPKMDWIKGIDSAEIPRVVANFLSSLMQAEPMVLVDGGTHRRTFLYVDDFIDGLMRIIKRPEASAGQIFNLGNPANEISMAQLAQHMGRVYQRQVGRDVQTQIVSSAEYYGAGYDDTVRRIPDIIKAKTLLDWEPSTTLDHMLELIVEDYVRRYELRLP